MVRCKKISQKNPRGRNIAKYATFFSQDFSRFEKNEFDPQKFHQKEKMAKEQKNPTQQSSLTLSHIIIIPAA